MVTAQELRRRAGKLRMVVSDVDGVLTDGGVYYSGHGEEMKRFNVRDGMGVELLRNEGIQTAFLTRESSPCVVARAEKLHLEHVALGVRNKGSALPELLRGAGVAADEVAYIGDDVNDLEALLLVAEAGLAGAPSDATQSVRRVVHYVTRAGGGHGAFREFADWLLSLK